MARQDASGLLDALLPCFQPSNVADGAVQHTLELARQLYQAGCEAGLELEASDWDGGLQRRMLALAQALTAWAPTAVQGLAVSPSGSRSRSLWMLLFLAGCCCLAALASMASRLGMQPGAALHIAAACQLVFSAGRLSTADLAATVEAEAAAGRQPQAPMLRLLWSLSALQLEAVARWAHLLLQDDAAGAAAAFARSTAKPAALLPWLAGILRAVLALRHPLDDRGSAPGGDPIHFFTALLCLLETREFADHRAAMTADSAMQDAIAAALLTTCLPYLAAQFGKAAAAGLRPSSHEQVRALCMLACAAEQRQLAQAVARHMRGPDAAATLRSAASVVAAVASLRADVPAGLVNHGSAKGNGYLGLHLHAADLLAACCRHLEQPPATAASGGRGGRGGNGGSSGNAAAGTGSEHQAIAWELVAAVPHICSAVRALATRATAADGGLLSVHAAVVCLYCMPLSMLPPDLTAAPCSAARLSAWAAAVEASLRLQPVLLQLDGALQQLPASNNKRHAASLMADQLFMSLSSPLPQLTAGEPGQNATAQPAPAALRRQLLQAHLAGCRLVHWQAQQAAAGRAAQLRGSLLGLPAVLLLQLQGLCHMLMRLVQMEQAAAGRDAGPPSAEVQAPCAAHVAAVGVLGGMAAAACAADPNGVEQDGGVVLPAIAGLASSLYDAIQIVPSLACAAALAPVEALLPALPQDISSVRVLANTFVLLARDEILNGRWAAAIAGSGLPAAGLDAVARLAALIQQSFTGLAYRTLQHVAVVLTSLHEAAEAATESGAASGLPDSLAAQLGTAVHSFQEQQAAVMRTAPSLLAEGAAELRRLLQPAASLAALLQQYYALPAVEQMRQLALAQAAAGRCCAYLRCANVGGEGGPAAGEGVGSKRCSACRAVWYCGTACSHANWREGGHRRVCRALGAARQAAKQARQAARAPAAAGQV